MMTLLLGLAAQTDLCIATHLSPAHRWLSNKDNPAVVVAVTRTVPSSLQLRRNNLRKLTSSQAASLVTDKLPAAKYYYLTEARFLDTLPERGTLPDGVYVTADIDFGRIAYISSLAPGHPSRVTRAPVVIATDVSLVAAVPLCGRYSL
jgi:hypothetical protein